ncbi:hypothetical protein ACROYT_G030450 [Oculina patagonica]
MRFRLSYVSSVIRAVSGTGISPWTVTFVASLVIVLPIVRFATSAASAFSLATSPVTVLVVLMMPLLMRWTLLSPLILCLMSVYVLPNVQRPESDSAADLESGELSESAVDSVESAEPVPTSTLDLGTGTPADDSVSTEPPPPMPSSVSEDSIDDFQRAYCPHAVVLRESDGSFSFIDLDRLTRRCVLEDTATPEMYRECFYSDPVMNVCRPAMKTTGDESGVPPASFPVVPAAESSASPAAESTASPAAEASASPAAESSACPAVDPVPIPAADINAPLEKLPKNFEVYEEIREFDYRIRWFDFPCKTPFPGPAASEGPSLSRDVVPQKFPGRPQKPRPAPSQLPKSRSALRH